MLAPSGHSAGLIAGASDEGVFVRLVVAIDHEVACLPVAEGFGDVRPVVLDVFVRGAIGAEDPTYGRRSKRGRGGEAGPAGDAFDVKDRVCAALGRALEEFVDGGG